MPISNMCSNKWGYKSYPMLGKDITAACLRMAKPALENPTPWSAMEQIKASFLFHANRFLREFQRMKIKIRNTK